MKKLLAVRAFRISPLLILALLIAFAPLPVAGAGNAGRDRFFRVQAGGYAFTPGVLHVSPGDRVTIELVASDVTHGLSIDGYPVDLQAEPGQPQSVTFVAGKPGSFKLRCSLACGALHPFMTGRFEVGPNLLLMRAAGLAVLAAIIGLWRPWK